MNAVDRVDNGETVYAVARSIGVTHKMLLDWLKPGQLRSHKNDLNLDLIKMTNYNIKTTYYANKNMFLLEK